MFFILFLVSLLAPAAKAQAAAEDTPTFRSGVSSVPIDVQVTQDNELVTGLVMNDFIITEQGVEQPITYFGRESEPVSLVLLLDVSGSMRKYIEQVAAVARQSLRYLRPQDRVSVMVFGRASKVRLDFSDSPSTVADELKEAVWDETLGAGTNINDALVAASNHMEENAPATGRRAILILTDNEGLNEKNPDAAVISALQQSNTVLNAIVVGKGHRPTKPAQTHIYRNPDFTPADVFAIAEETGGEAVKAAEAGKAFSRMIERIRTRYSLHYNKPESGGSGFRKVEVRLTAEAQARYPRAMLRHRRGYRVTP
jgi:VWFA-related protein